ncbi:hypothetical protein FB451DRAFT_1393407 [Mycena latifolia]|nr:hypothetical protein FB451DRAFT_1393407 [Mycena latifolia]
MPLASAIDRFTELARLYSLVALYGPWLFLWCVARRPSRRRRHGGVPELLVLPYPRRIPTDRVDICPNQIAQPPTCYLLHLPTELRYLIFEMATGNRLVQLRMVPDHRIHELRIHTTCYGPSEEPDTPNTLLVTLLVPTDKISFALSLSCRQVYFEALAVMHGRNTFHFYLEDFLPAIQCELGDYCLPDIRRVYLSSRYPDRPLMWQWAPAFVALRRMGLHTLTLEFAILEWTELHPSTFSVDNAWCRSLLAIRDLHHLHILFRDGNPPDSPMHREYATQILCDLMIGPEADEKYGRLLTDRNDADGIIRNI